MKYSMNCDICGIVEIEHPMAEDHPEECPGCGSKKFRRVFGEVGLSFVGSGFYSTDSILSDPDPDTVLDKKLDRKSKGLDV